MTAIAGIAGPCPQARLEHSVRALADEQRRYGSQRTQLLSIDGASFAASPSEGSSAEPAVDDHLLLTTDVRFDNRRELLDRAGLRGRDCSDSELLLALWRKLGADCLALIAGDFAIAVFDSRTASLTLARDPTGQTPLHYARLRHSCVFATMPAAMRAVLQGFAVDPLAMAATVCLLREEDSRSHFCGVYRVLPGEVVTLGPNGTRRHIYWAPATAVDDPIRDTDLVEQYRAVLDDAVAGRINSSDAPLASHLSSGYDSSAVTATAARLVASPREVVAFTSSPIGRVDLPSAMRRVADESEIARATADWLGIRHVIVRGRPTATEVIRRQSLLFQQPVLAVTNASWLLEIRKQAAAMGATCLLTGEMGNATLNAGGLDVLSEWIRRFRWVTWARQARMAAARGDTSWRGVLFSSLRTWAPEFVTRMLRRRYLGLRPTEEISFLRPEWRQKALSEAKDNRSFPNIYAERAYAIRDDDPGLLRKGAFAGEGIHQHDPLADRRLIEFSLRIPPECMYWNGVPRPLAREALSDRLPGSIIDLPVRGAQSTDWALHLGQAEARQLLEEVSRSATAREIFDLGRMEKAIDRWPTSGWNERNVSAEYRLALIGALSCGMFSLLNEQNGRPDYPS